MFQAAAAPRPVLCRNAKVKQLRPFARGTWGGEFHPDLQPAEGDIVVQEHWLHSGFATTDLAYQLQNRGIDHIVLARMRANMCVEATARYGVELGYHVTIAKDATGTARWEEWVGGRAHLRASLSPSSACANVARGRPRISPLTPPRRAR